ncbi:MAG: thiolase family protein [Gammaproteobacteria bacterium]|jgi:acetyl-CoA acetyltransferase|nr:thiolase family protein [Gammaproteobacteria bacterium]MBP6050379.1 thiolase family protein [Pseudomonadales bacterium]MBK6583702.1 thiolase family protein [Gammaproteobacteria bacterium]MBK7170280.1 thiolase family protein [Gammaproteobacteria bacterium]MBK7727485.1 thiolase family protein [Gammaproteobacteria bacterium]
MKQNAYIAGIGMTKFGKHLDRGLKSLAGEAISDAVADAGIGLGDLQAAYMGNAAAAVITGQVCVPGQMILRSLGVGRIAVVNVENACATAATAFQQACTMVSAGLYDVVLACGVEKLYHQDKLKTFSVFSGAVDVEAMDQVIAGIGRRIETLDAPIDTAGAGTTRSLFMDIYATWALAHMKRYGTTREQFAAVSAKNSVHGSLNPKAQYRDVISVQEVLAAREVSWPLTLPMCSPIGDGAAAAVIVSERKRRELGIARAVKVEACVLASGWDYAEGEESVAEGTARALYESAGVGPADIDCVELHDASAPSELMYYEYLGLCPRGEGGRFVADGHSRLGGRQPVNTSGGLMRKGHPIGATGLAQIVELTEQLRGEAGQRQVQGAKVALAENGGGFIGTDAAAMVMTLLSR